MAVPGLSDSSVIGGKRSRELSPGTRSHHLKILTIWRQPSYGNLLKTPSHYTRPSPKLYLTHHISLLSGTASHPLIFLARDTIFISGTPAAYCMYALVRSSPRNCISHTSAKCTAYKGIVWETFLFTPCNTCTIGTDYETYLSDSGISP